MTTGDFGVSTIMDDARTRTRTTVGRFLLDFINLLVLYAAVHLGELPLIADTYLLWKDGLHSAFPPFPWQLL